MTSLSLILSPSISTLFSSSTFYPSLSPFSDVIFIFSLTISLCSSPIVFGSSSFILHRLVFFSFPHFIFFSLTNLPISSSSEFVPLKFFSPLICYILPTSSPHHPHSLSSSLQFSSSSVSIFFLSFDFISLNSVFPSNLHLGQYSSSFLYLYSLSVSIFVCIFPLYLSHVAASSPVIARSLSLTSFYWLRITSRSTLSR